MTQSEDTKNTTKLGQENKIPEEVFQEMYRKRKIILNGIGARYAVELNAYYGIPAKLLSEDEIYVWAKKAGIQDCLV